MSPDCELLAKALLAEPAAAKTFICRWRSETNLEAMSEDCIRLLPVLVARDSSWLAGDPARSLILGLSKRAWTRNQLLLRFLSDLVEALSSAGISPITVTGPAACALRYQGEMLYRHISFLELLVPREQALAAAAALRGLGWTLAPGQTIPQAMDFDHIEGIWFRNRSGEGLRLAWRLFPAPPEHAAEWETLSPLRAVEFQGSTRFIPSTDLLLASTLAGESTEDDSSWRCDAALLLKDSTVDWSSVKKWIQFSPIARVRLLQLDATGATIPQDLRRRPMRLWFQWELVRDDYQRRARKRGVPRSLGGFFRYLCDRWQTSAWQMPFLGLFYLVRYTFPAGLSSGGKRSPEV